MLDSPISGDTDKKQENMLTDKDIDTKLSLHVPYQEAHKLI